jgi:hypothetical protein
MFDFTEAEQDQRELREWHRKTSRHAAPRWPRRRKGNRQPEQSCVIGRFPGQLLN